MSETENGSGTNAGWYEQNGLMFSCNQCSDCCRKPPALVLLSGTDLERLAKWAGVTEEQFTLMYCRWIPLDDGYDYLSLREKKNYDCIFWNNGGCEAYTARPVQCSTYPFWTEILASPKSWQEEAKECPGINEGDVVPGREITAQLERYESRDKIRRPWQW